MGNAQSEPVVQAPSDIGSVASTTGRTFIYVPPESFEQIRQTLETMPGVSRHDLVPLDQFPTSIDSYSGLIHAHLLFLNSLPPAQIQLFLAQRPNVGSFLIYDNEASLEEVASYLQRPQESHLADSSTQRIDDLFIGIQRKPQSQTEWACTIAIALEHLRNKVSNHLNLLEISNKVEKIQKMNRIGSLISQKLEEHQLFERILHAARDLTHSEAGSLYVVTEKGSTRSLTFKHAQNEAVPLPFKEFSIPLNKSSIAGYVASTGLTLNIADVYEIPDSAEYSFNREFDTKSGYRTGSMITFPLKTQKQEIIGVIQLINKRSPLDPEGFVTFDRDDESFLDSLSSLAASALLNNRLYREIQNLLEGFIKASVTAIEYRDPTTFGHSERVAKLTSALAEAIDKETLGPYKDLTFNRDQLLQINYAALLHDFGKIGVRENVLTKSKKLFPEELREIVARFDQIRNAIKIDKTSQFVANQQLSKEDYKRLEQFLKELDHEFQDYLDIILRSNEPTVLEEGDFSCLQRLGQKYFTIGTDRQPFLNPREIERLSIQKGSLSTQERSEIESHVIHSYNFLCQIPWTTELKRIPEIVIGHHERLNGKGYPYGKHSNEIAVEAKIMAIPDIYDALTAQDRPYKKAVPQEKALSILEMETESGLLDPEMFRIFIDAEVFRLIK